MGVRFGGRGRIRGRVLPSTTDNVRLQAELSDGTLIEGETHIAGSTQPIKHVMLEPPQVSPLEETLGAIELAPSKRLVVVDAGAVRFVVNGADIMKPGIVSADPEIAVGDLVIVMEERHKKPLAVGRALVAGCEMKGEGKAVKSLHHVGDIIWKGLED